VKVRRSPAFGHTLRTNYGSDLSVFLATCPRDGVPAKLANHRVSGQRVGWRFRGNAEFLPAIWAFVVTDSMKLN
jgi:hypothetical protein